MVYLGSKRRLAKDLIPILTKELDQDTYYVEPFVGGANLIDKIQHKKKIGSDSNKYLIALLKYVQAGNRLPTFIPREEYLSVKNNINNYPDWYVGFVGFCCSFRGKFFNSWIGRDVIKNNSSEKGKIRHYQTEQINNLQSQDLSNITFLNTSYDTLEIPGKSVIYCDPPYKNTTGYKDKFDHNKFWNWVREKTLKGHKVFISEYEAPQDFRCIWSKEQKKNPGGKAKTTTEKLFTYGLDI